MHTNIIISIDSSFVLPLQSTTIFQKKMTAVPTSCYY